MSFERLTNSGTREAKIHTTIAEACGRLSDYEDSELSPQQVAELQAENVNLKKLFALACRCLADNVICPSADEDADFLECNGEMEMCGDVDLWECWQKYFKEIVKKEAVCRVCGCTWNNACHGGCSWAEEDLCSACADK